MWRANLESLKGKWSGAASSVGSSSSDRGIGAGPSIKKEGAKEDDARLMMAMAAVMERLDRLERPAAKPQPNPAGSDDDSGWSQAGGPPSK